MSTRYEWFDAASVGVDYVPPGETVDGSDPVVGPFPDELVAEKGAIVISGDECTVLHGTPAELRALATRIMRAIPEDNDQTEVDRALDESADMYAGNLED